MEGAVLKETLRERAAELGLPLFGVAPPTLADPFDRFLENWLAEGRQARMDWMSQSGLKRLDARLLLPQTEAVLMVGMPYPALPHPVQHPSEGRISRYAQVPDYHGTLRQKLKGLVNFLTQHQPEMAGQIRCCVDTAPLLERAFAWRAGLGFFGKNQCLIHPKWGSWFFLGALLLPFSLPFDSPRRGSCGDCRRCIEACPAQALSEKGLDCRRCLSFWTIEHKGSIPDALKLFIKDRLFGCDTCQEICPFQPRQPLKPPPERSALMEATRLESLLNLPSNKAFAKAFGGTAFLRAGRPGILRNAAIVASSLQRKDLREAIALRCQDSVLPDWTRLALQDALDQLEKG